jgi:DNA-binding TFAR19-related protein (PDSD5 family)
MIQLARKEYQGILRCQFGTLEKGKYSKYLPYAFTEQGVAMLSSVLNSERAIQVNILIMRAFTRLREILLTHRELASKVETLEKKYAEHDETIKEIFESIKQLLEPRPEKEKRIIGFTRK